MFAPVSSTVVVDGPVPVRVAHDPRGYAGALARRCVREADVTGRYVRTPPKVGGVEEIPSDVSSGPTSVRSSYRKRAQRPAEPGGRPMTATTLTTTASQDSRIRSNRHLLRRGAAAGVTAAVATTAVAAGADADRCFPCRRWRVDPAARLRPAHTLRHRHRRGDGRRHGPPGSVRPRRTFVSTTLVLTALSFVPDVLADAQASTKLTLMLTHVVAAAIVIPALASRLAD